MPGAIPDAQAAEAVERYQAGEYAEAARLLGAAVERHPEEEALHLMLVSALVSDGRAERAALRAEEALERFPESVALLLLKGEVQMQQEEPLAALETFEVVQERLDAGAALPEGFSFGEFPERIGQLHQLAGGQAYEQGEYARALEHFEKARELLPGSPSTHQNVAYTHLLQGEYEQSLVAAEAGLERFPEHEALLRITSQALRHLDRYDELSTIHERLYRLRPDDLEVGLAYAQVLLVTRQEARAQEVFGELMERFPDNRDVYEAVAGVYLERMNLPGAIDVWQRAQEQFPEDKSIARRIATLYEQSGEYEEARAIHDSLYAVGGDGALKDGHAAARTFEYEERPADAEVAYRELLEEHPEHMGALRGLGTVLEQQRTWEAALATYDQLAAVASDADAIAHAHTRRGWILERLRRNEEALAAYERALEEEPDDPLPYYRYAARVQGRDGTEAAYSHARRALDRAFQAVEALQSEVMGQLEGRRALLPSMDAVEQRQRVQEVNDLAAEIFSFFGESFPREETEPVILELHRQHADSGRMQYLVGAYYVAHGEEGEALRFLERATRQSPSLREAHLAIGALYEERGEVRPAILSYERARSLDETDPEAYRALVEIHHQEGQLDALIRRWQARLRTSAENEVLREHLLDALHKAGRHEEARQLAREGS